MSVRTTSKVAVTLASEQYIVRRAKQELAGRDPHFVNVTPFTVDARARIDAYKAAKSPKATRKVAASATVAPPSKKAKATKLTSGMVCHYKGGHFSVAALRQAEWTDTQILANCTF